MALIYPPVGFHFILRFEGLLQQDKYKGIPDIGFRKASGINLDIPVEEYQEGGENRFKHRLPNPPSYQNLTLERGMLIGSQLMQWYKASIEGFAFDPNDITLILLNYMHLPLQAWNFVNAYPIKWSVSDLNAQENAIVVETVEFAYQYFRRIDPSDILAAI